ncbi:hypothetical protein MiSe_14320 [Microseira wollei NIES-4236]|uniref:Uncharacterized protein n=1 Tax=Microseira wollei NIES-4236 TaxID=2530354 RepID=A0AAV3X4E6_9CYAN|nr:hypothetical protein MiSe_14320 [Microseira wollei NIES-4236]
MSFYLGWRSGHYALRSKETKVICVSHKNYKNQKRVNMHQTSAKTTLKGGQNAHPTRFIAEVYCISAQTPQYLGKGQDSFSLWLTLKQ